MKYATTVLLLILSSLTNAIEPIVINPENAEEYGIVVMKKEHKDLDNRISYIVQYPDKVKINDVEEPGFAQIHIFYEKGKSINIPQFGGYAKISSDKEGIELSKVTINYGEQTLKRFLVIPLTGY